MSGEAEDGEWVSVARVEERLGGEEDIGDGEELVSTVRSMNRLQPTRSHATRSFPAISSHRSACILLDATSAAVGAAAGEVHGRAEIGEMGEMVTLLVSALRVASEWSAAAR